MAFYDIQNKFEYNVFVKNKKEYVIECLQSYCNWKLDLNVSGKQKYSRSGKWVIATHTL